MPGEGLRAALDALGPVGRSPDELLAAVARYRSEKAPDGTDIRLVPAGELPGLDGTVVLGSLMLAGDSWTSAGGVADGFATLASWTGLGFEVRLESGERLEAGVFPSTLGQVLVWKALLTAMNSKELAVCIMCGDMYDRRNKNTKTCRVQCQKEYKARQRSDLRRRHEGA